MISDGNVHEEDWFEAQIVRTGSVTADNYAGQRELGLYEYGHPEIPSGTDVITVRYRDGDGGLMWLDTIPILADDVWIDGVANMYLASDKDAGVTSDDPGWTAMFQDIGEDKPYLWNYEIVRYRDGKADRTEPSVVARWTGGGMGIRSVTEHYLFSDRDKGVATSDSGWSETLESDPGRRYLWNYEKIEYTTGETTLTSPAIIGTNGMKGDKGVRGDDGSRGGQYWGRTAPAAPVKGDTYLDVAGMHLMEHNGTAWTALPYTDTRYTQAVQDIIASATDSAQLMQVANAWVANLVAGTVLANQLMAKQLTVQDGGCIQSQNHKAGVSGWRIGSDGRAEFEDGVFRGEVNATSGVFESVTIKSSCIIEGVAVVNNTPFTPAGSVKASLDPYDGSASSWSGKNVTSITYQGTGTFRLNFRTPLQIQYKTISGYKFIDLFCVGNGYLYERGYMTTLIPTVNWSRTNVDGVFTENNGRISVTYVDIIFYQAGLGGGKANPNSMHLFLFYTEV